MVEAVDVEMADGSVAVNSTPESLNDACRRLLMNVHAVLAVLAYLPRAKKFSLQVLSRAFREHITFKSLVSARFIGHDVITHSTLLDSIVSRSRKLTKLEINEVIVDMAYVSALERKLMINQMATQEASEETKNA